MLRQLTAGIADPAEIIPAQQKQSDGVVRLIASGAPIDGLLLGKLPALGKRNGSIQVQLGELDEEDQLLAISRGEADHAACRRPTTIPEGWAFRSLREDRLVVICRADDPLSKSRKVG